MQIVRVSQYQQIAKRPYGLWIAVWFACALFLPLSAHAVASLVTSTSFTPADGMRTTMDSGGVWNGATEVTNTTGDTFSFIIENTAGGPVINDSAFDLAIGMSLPSQFRLAFTPFNVTVTELSGNAGCGSIAGVTATQAGGVGTAVTVNVPADTDILPSCRYQFDLGVTTTDVAPFATAGSYSIDFDLSYNEIDDDAATQQTASDSQSITVETGDVAVIKTAVTSSAADGDTVEYTVSVLGSGDGGIFDVVLTDVLSSDLTGLTFLPPGSPPGSAGPGANEYTLNYLESGELVDVTVQATVAVDPNAVTCPVLSNDVTATDRTGETDSDSDEVAFDLDEPNVTFTAQTINVPFGVVGVDITVPVNNVGSGPAKDIQITIAGIGAFNVTIDGASSPNWSYLGAGVFQFNGLMAAGAGENLVFNVQSNSCPAPAGGGLTWGLDYSNACGTAFVPADQTSNIAMVNQPDATITKTASSGAINVNQAGNYTLQLGGTNIANLPEVDADDSNNNDFSVTDTLPTGVTNVVINAIPAGTEVLVGGLPYVAGSPIVDNATIEWNGDLNDLATTPALTVDYVGGDSGSACPTGQTVTNTANLNYPGCGIASNDSASFILSENPAGGATLNIAVGGDGTFEAGAPDTDNTADTEIREGEHMPFQVSYSFPSGWGNGTELYSGSTFTADLRSGQAGQPLTLINGGSDLRVTVVQAGVPLCTNATIPGAFFTGGDGSGALVVNDLDTALTGAGCAVPAVIDDVDITFDYTATSAEGDLDGNNNPINENNIGGYIENTTLTIANAAPGCTGVADFIQGINVNIERADVTPGVTINGGNPVSVCEVVPITVNLNAPAADTNADNILYNWALTDLEIVDGADVASADVDADITRSGGATGLTLTSPAGNNTGPITWELQPIETNYTAGGQFTFNARILDLGAALNAQVDFDSNHTSPDIAAATDDDRDYLNAVNVTPSGVGAASIDMQIFPSTITLRDQTQYSFTVHLTNTSFSDAIDPVYRIDLPAGMALNSAVATNGAVAVTSGTAFVDQVAEWSIATSGNTLPLGGQVDITITVDINQTSCFQGAGNEITSENEWGCGVPQINSATSPAISLPNANLDLTHDTNNSTCVLCGEGEIRLIATNSGGVLLTNVSIEEDLAASGLTIVPGSVSYYVDGSLTGAGAPFDPVVSGANDEVLTWDGTIIPELDNLYSAFNTAPNTPQTIEIRFRVERNSVGGFDDEGLVTADRTIQATGRYGLFCDVNAVTPLQITETSALFEIPIDQPEPDITKQGRNVTANQSSANYSAAGTVFGGSDDVLIWRMTIDNDGDADMEDINFHDLIEEELNATPTRNFVSEFLCPTEADATAAAGGAPPATCLSLTPSLLGGPPLGEEFSSPLATDYDPLPTVSTTIPANSSETVFVVGTIQNFCTNMTNAADIEWGCFVDSPPVGGITAPATTGGLTPAFDINDDEFMSTDVDPAGVLVSHTVTGADGGAELGSRGVVTITIDNQSGGTVRNMTLLDNIPTGYALDTSLMTVSVTPAFGSYTGIIDTISLTNEDLVNPENNTAPEFELLSDVTHSGSSNSDENLFRHGDVMTITLGIVQVTNFDTAADPEVRVESTGDATDPTPTTPVNNSVEVGFENSCSTPLAVIGAASARTDSVNNIVVDPEDLDININPTDTDLIYTIADPTNTLDLDVVLTNNGGHEATNYFALVTVGTGLTVIGLPADCGVANVGIGTHADAGVPPRPILDPPGVAGTSVVYQCATTDPLPAGASDTFTFQVQKNGAGADLTFRADVVGEITQNDGTALTFPTPVGANVANNYSFDSIVARIIGFNLTKNVVSCSEGGVPADTQAPEAQIGEECTYRIEAGWFGFTTPGFGGITVDTIQIVDTIPDGFGYVSDDTSGSSFVVTGTTSSTPGGASSADADVEEITEFVWDVTNSLSNDETFTADLVLRVLNDPVDSSAVPNVHAATQTDQVNASFNVNFGADVSTFDNTTPNYPPANLREVDTRIAEPNLSVVKTVCNNGNTSVANIPGCTFSDPIAGDVQDFYIYRLVITNETDSGGLNRKPAFDVVVTDALDSCSATVDPATDGIDNDGDGNIDGADGDGEGSVSGAVDCVTFAGNEQIVFDATNTADLAQIDPGDSVTMYYMVDPDNNAVPGTTLSNTATLDYDSLLGATGSQTAPLIATSNSAGARAYTTSDTADLNLDAPTAATDSKGIIDTTLVNLGDTTLCTPDAGNSVCTGIGAAANNIQYVNVGEEVLFELRATMPAATYNNLTVRDELPDGLDCIEIVTDAAFIDINAMDGNADADTSTDGTLNTGTDLTCTDSVVEWRFGNETIISPPQTPLVVRFIARVENDANTNDTDVIRNGGATTLAEVQFEDGVGTPLTPVTLGPTDLTIAEPDMDLAITMGAPITNADGSDRITVTVDATNNGTGPAYNLEVLFNETLSPDLSFVATSAAGTNAPDSSVVGANGPVFAWDTASNPLYPIDPAETVSFTFQVDVSATVEPSRVLDAAIQTAWTSLPAATSALNSGGSIGANGAATGMRDGTVPPTADAVNDYEDALTDTSVSVLAPSIAKSDQNAATVPAIGEHKQFRLTIDLTEGQTQSLLVTDNLSAGDVSYVLENDATFDISYTFTGIASINGGAVNESSFTAFPADESNGIVTWNIGTVTTSTEDDLTTSVITPRIEINYFARINNDTSTDDADDLDNTAQVDSRNGETLGTNTDTDAGPTITVVEPSLDATKTVSNISNPGFAPDAGDVLEFAITVENIGNSTAYDVNLVDTLPAAMTFDNTFIPTATIGGVGVVGFTATPSGAPGGPLIWGRGNADETLDIPVGAAQTLVLTYRTVVANNVEPDQDIANSVDIDWTSLDGSSALERTGAGCPVTVAPNDYCLADVTSSVTVDDRTNIDKSFISDTYVVGGLSTAVDSLVRVGDVVRYELRLTIQEGTTENLSIVDTLPNGMEFLQVVSVDGDTTAPYAPTSLQFSAGAAIAAPIATSGAGANTVTWTIGDITNAADNNTANDEFVIIYEAQVVNDELAIPQNANTSLQNSADLSYLDAADATQNDNDTVTITAQEPIFLLADLTKTTRVSGVVSGDTITPGDTMDFRLEVCNSGDAPAYDTVIEDDLPVELEEGTITGPVNGAGAPDVYANGVLLTEGAANDYSYTAPAGSGGIMVFDFHSVAINPAASTPNNCITIEYDIDTDASIGINQSWDNQVDITEYHSLDDGDTNVAERETYAAVGPVLFNMNTANIIEPPTKTLASPANPEATIGETIVYQITVPGNSVPATLFDINISDDLASNLTYVSAVLDGASTYSGAIDDTASIAPNQVRIAIDEMPPNEQAVINITARVNNDAVTNTATTPFANTVGYFFAASDGGVQTDAGTATTAALDDLSIIEPQLALAKAVANQTNPGNPPDAGDVLRYTLTLTAAGGAVGDAFSDAFDVTINDTLGLGLLYSGSPSVDGAGNTIGAPVTNAGDGVNTSQTLRWSLSDANSDIDVTEGAAVTVTYDVVVVDEVQANQDLDNAANLQWTSLDGVNANERNGGGGINDYFTADQIASVTTPNNTSFAKSRSSDTFGTGDDDVRIGDVVTYELRISMQEGLHPDLTLVDTLPQGLELLDIVSINGDTTAPYSNVTPFIHSDIAAADIVAAGDASLGATTITFDLGDVINDGDNSAANDDFVILYRAKTLNNDVFSQLNTINLQNSVDMDYDTATGATPTQNETYTVDLLQPDLSVTKAAAPAGGDAVVDASEVVTYTVTVTNNGTAPAYNLELEDTLPEGMRDAGITMVSTQVNGVFETNLGPVYNAVTGVAQWVYDTATAEQYAINPGQTLQIVYTATVDADAGPGLTLDNAVRGVVYYSFDADNIPSGSVVGEREVYGPTNTAVSNLTTPLPGNLSKANPVRVIATIGEEFTYRVTVPAAPEGVALYDIRVLDDLDLSGVDLEFVSVSRISGPAFTPVNTGTSTDLIIEDTTNGIDVPAGQQAVIDITVRMRDTVTNLDTVTFANTASYTYNQINDDSVTEQNGGGDTTANMTVVEPDLQVSKTGPATMQFGTPATFTVDVFNSGTSEAFDVTITDLIPNPATGGLCDTAPANITATLLSGPTLLTDGVDYTTSFVGDPTCTFTLTLTNPLAAIDAGDTLRITYDLTLDVDNANGTVLNNLVGATEWFSLDTAGVGATGEIRTYSETITDGTSSTTDFQDVRSITVQAPVLSFEKAVVNLTSGDDPGLNAEPGDTLRYTLTVNNTGPVGSTGMSIVDEIDALNVIDLFESAPGSLVVQSVPAGAVDASDANGGAAGSGLLDISNLAIDASGGANDSFQIVFDVTLIPVIASGTVAFNQAALTLTGFSDILSDDPNLGGTLDPTQTIIGSLPAFQIQKTVADITDDANLTVAGDTLRYTITVKNIGQDDSLNTLLRDQVPALTTYVADSVTLNGASVGAPDGGVSPLNNGILINAPENTTAGYMRADSDPAANNVATITFDVVTDSDLVNGASISNQAFITGSGAGLGGAYPAYPSDDPGTPIVNDPTVTVIGNAPSLIAQKTVSLLIDLAANDVIDPNDTVQYQFDISNVGGIDASSVVLTDSIPAGMNYVANSTTLNSVAVGTPDGGVLPLAAGLDIQSSDLPGAGIMTAGESALVTFNATVDGATAVGTVISNQGTVTADTLPDLPTDADGNDQNGAQPTEFVVGGAQQLSITKDVFVVGGGTATAGGQLEYVIRVENTGAVDVSDIVITDDLDAPIAGQIDLLPGSAEMNGSSAGVAFADPLITADYAASYGDLGPGEVITLRFIVDVDAALSDGTTIENTADLSWNAASQNDSATVSVDVGAAPGLATVTGTVWHDANHDDLLDAGDTVLPDWAIDLSINGAIYATDLSDATGVYRFVGLPPSGSLGSDYQLDFSMPGETISTATIGTTVPNLRAGKGTAGRHVISAITLNSGDFIDAENLPIDPNGVVYDSVLRVPVVGTTVTLYNAATSLPVSSNCFDDPAQQGQETGTDGYYQFAINFSQGDCPAGADYLLVLGTAPSYQTPPSQIIPPITSSATPAFDVPACGGGASDTVPTTAECEVQVQVTAPDSSIAPATAGTNHYLHVTLDNGVIPADSEAFNNHLPMDPFLNGAVTLSKTSPLVNVVKGQLVPYTITMTNNLSAPLQDIVLIDDMPPGFKYVEGSATLNGTNLEPTVNVRQLSWDALTLNTNETLTFKMLLIVGAGVGEGEYVNYARAFNTITNDLVGAQVSATVRVVPDPTFDCTDVIGKVYDDANHNGYQDEGEQGLPSVRLATARGLLVTTDEFGRFHIACAAVPNPDRGSNFILKVDPRSLPSGYRMTTENPRVLRATRGKALKFNFGASIHRVVRLDLADGVFESGSTWIRPQWQDRVDRLIKELKVAPSVLRLSYLAETEPESLVKARLEGMRKEIERRWSDMNCCYNLRVETEVYWRSGGPIRLEEYDE